MSALCCLTVVAPLFAGQIVAPPITVRVPTPPPIVPTGGGQLGSSLPRTDLRPNLSPTLSLPTGSLPTSTLPTGGAPSTRSGDVGSEGRSFSPGQRPGDAEGQDGTTTVVVPPPPREFHEAPPDGGGDEDEDDDKAGLSSADSRGKARWIALFVIGGLIVYAVSRGDRNAA